MRNISISSTKSEMRTEHSRDSNQPLHIPEEEVVRSILNGGKFDSIDRKTARYPIQRLQSWNNVDHHRPVSKVKRPTYNNDRNFKHQKTVRKDSTNLNRMAKIKAPPFSHERQNMYEELSVSNTPPRRQTHLSMKSHLQHDISQHNRTSNIRTRIAQNFQERQATYSYNNRKFAQKRLPPPMNLQRNMKRIALRRLLPSYGKKDLKKPNLRYHQFNILLKNNTSFNVRQSFLHPQTINATARGGGRSIYLEGYLTLTPSEKLRRKIYYNDLNSTRHNLSTLAKKYFEVKQRTVDSRGTSPDPYSYTQGSVLTTNTHIPLQKIKVDFSKANSNIYEKLFVLRIHETKASSTKRHTTLKNQMSFSSGNESVSKYTRSFSNMTVTPKHTYSHYSRLNTKLDTDAQSKLTHFAQRGYKKVHEKQTHINWVWPNMTLLENATRLIDKTPFPYYWADFIWPDSTFDPFLRMKFYRYHENANTKSPTTLYERPSSFGDFLKKRINLYYGTNPSLTSTQISVIKALPSISPIKSPNASIVTNEMFREIADKSKEIKSPANLSTSATLRTNYYNNYNSYTDHYTARSTQKITKETFNNNVTESTLTSVKGYRESNANRTRMSSRDNLVYSAQTLTTLPISRKVSILSAPQTLTNSLHSSANSQISTTAHHLPAVHRKRIKKRRRKIKRKKNITKAIGEKENSMMKKRIHFLKRYFTNVSHSPNELFSVKPGNTLLANHPVTSTLTTPTIRRQNAIAATSIDKAVGSQATSPQIKMITTEIHNQSPVLEYTPEAYNLHSRLHSLSYLQINTTPSSTVKIKHSLEDTTTSTFPTNNGSQIKSTIHSLTHGLFNSRNPSFSFTKSNDLLKSVPYIPETSLTIEQTMKTRILSEESTTRAPYITAPMKTKIPSQLPPMKTKRMVRISLEESPTKTTKRTRIALAEPPITTKLKTPAKRRTNMKRLTKESNIKTTVKVSKPLEELPIKTTIKTRMTLGETPETKKTIKTRRSSEKPKIKTRIPIDKSPPRTTIKMIIPVVESSAKTMIKTRLSSEESTRAKTEKRILLEKSQIKTKIKTRILLKKLQTTKKPVESNYLLQKSPKTKSPMTSHFVERLLTKATIRKSVLLDRESSMEAINFSLHVYQPTMVTSAKNTLKSYRITSNDTLYTTSRPSKTKEDFLTALTTHTLRTLSRKIRIKKGTSPTTSYKNRDMRTLKLQAEGFSYSKSSRLNLPNLPNKTALENTTATRPDTPASATPNLTMLSISLNDLINLPKTNSSNHTFPTTKKTSVTNLHTVFKTQHDLDSSVNSSAMNFKTTKSVTITGAETNTVEENSTGHLEFIGMNLPMKDILETKTSTTAPSTTTGDDFHNQETTDLEKRSTQLYLKAKHRNISIGMHNKIIKRMKTRAEIDIKTPTQNKDIFVTKCPTTSKAVFSEDFSKRPISKNPFLNHIIHNPFIRKNIPDRAQFTRNPFPKTGIFRKVRHKSNPFRNPFLPHIIKRNPFLLKPQTVNPKFTFRHASSGKEWTSETNAEKSTSAKNKGENTLTTISKKVTHFIRTTAKPFIERETKESTTIRTTSNVGMEKTLAPTGSPSTTITREIVKKMQPRRSFDPENVITSPLTIKKSASASPENGILSSTVEFVTVPTSIVTDTFETPIKLNAEAELIIWTAVKKAMLATHQNLTVDTSKSIPPMPDQLLQYLLQHMGSSVSPAIPSTILIPTSAPTEKQKITTFSDYFYDYYKENAEYGEHPLSTNDRYIKINHNQPQNAYYYYY